MACVAHSVRSRGDLPVGETDSLGALVAPVEDAHEAADGSVDGWGCQIRVHAEHLLVVVRAGVGVDDQTVPQREAHLVNGQLDDLIISSLDLPFTISLAPVVHFSILRVRCY